MRGRFIALFLALAALPAGHARGADWRSAPIVPTITRATAKRIGIQLDDARAHDNRAGVFAKSGDSITFSSSFLYGTACGEEILPPRLSYLRSTIDYFSRARFRAAYSNVYCGVANSFSRTSSAAGGGWLADWANLPGFPASACGARASPVRCEVRTVRPAFALVAFGTNDASRRRSLHDFRAAMGRVVSQFRTLHVIPILYTLPPRLDDPVANNLVLGYNRAIFDLARTRKLLLINFWRALQGQRLIDRGMWHDGIHPNAKDDGFLSSIGCIPLCNPLDFTPQGLRYGFNQRNLITLRTLDRLRTRVIAPPGRAG